ncbi:MAG: hypothetical protein FWG66_11985 [Spirochaetes bacterium]|nr:hypothetical protein [Spirochaetota bacterium]
MLFYLYDAAGWLRFVGILLLIKSGLFILGGLVFSIGILVASGFTYVYDDYGLEFMGLAFALLGAVFFFPARYVYRFGTKIRKYRFSKKDGDMESALKNNKSFWKFAGILCIVFLALIPLFLVLAIAGGILAGFGAAIL